jgi:hypothetical protein
VSKSLNDEVRQAFSKLTLPPPPSLLDRIRESIWSSPAPAAPQPVVPSARVGPAGSRTAAGRRPVPGAVLVAATLVIALAAGALIIGPGGLGRQVAGVLGLMGSAQKASTGARPAASQPAQTPALAASPTEAPTPVPSATPATPAPTPAAPAPLPGYACTTQSGGGSAPSTMTAARVGAQSGYDRFVVQFSGSVPLFEVRPQDSASLAVGGSGATVSLLGSAGLGITLRNTSGAEYLGPSDFRPGFSVIREARLLSDSGGVVQWGIGLSHASCFHAWTLAGPSRLVIDVQH